MGPCYDALRRTLVASLVTLIASAAPAAAQFMYLDADGDGVPTSADVVTPGGPVVFDVWLVTDHDADGTLKTCALDGATPLSIRGYYFVLKVRNGELAVSSVTNQISSFTQTWADSHTSTQILLWRSGETPLPPGTYRLATVTAQIIQGTPSISIVADSEGGPASITHFESECPGLALDGTLLLGGDWFDTAGLAYGGEENRPPAIEAIANMIVAEADSATQTVRASDPEGQVITLVQTHGPAFMTFASTPSAAEATGQVVLRPGYGDAGVSSGTILATDGLLTDQLSFEITVLNRNRPPVLEPIADLQAEVGLTTEVGIVASDPDGTALTIGYTGPSFSYLDAHSVIRIAPSVYDAVGGYPATVTASDGEATVSRGFTITVVHTLHAPVVEPVQNMVVTEGDTLFQDVRAYDPDGDALGFEPIGFPPFMHLDPLPSKPPDASARIVIEPRPGDAGVLSLGVRVLDGVFHTEVYFQVTVLAAPHGSTLLELSHAPELPDIPWQTIRFDDSEGTFQVSGSPQTGVSILFAALDDPNEVQLACLPAQRAECVSDPLHMWWLKFMPPTGHPLVPGVYPVASEVPDAEHAGFEVTRLCGSLSTCAVSGVEFEVKEIAFASTGEVSSFWATFHQQCSNEASRIWGEVRYQATPQVYLQAPSRTRAHAGAPLTIDMKVSGSVPGPYTLVSSDLPAGAALTLHDDGTAEIQWTPDLEQQGLYDIHLIAGVADATPDTTELLVCVDIPGAVTATMDANRTRVITTNRGDAAFDALQNAPGAFHPGGSTIPIARSIELMVGATVQGETRLDLGNYDQDFAPGPMRNGEAAPFELRFKNYTIRSASPYGYDWEHWPVDLGAPVDETGQPRVLGDATIWSIYNDAAPHPSPRLTAPLGIEVRQTTWARSSPEPVGDVVYQEYRIRNGNSVPLEGVYAGWLVDAITISYEGGDVGIPSRDAVGCDTTLAMGYAYSATYYGEPNAVGLVLIQAPPDGQIPLAAVQERGYPSGAQAFYNQLQGLRPDGTPRHEYDDPARPVTTYAFTGDPVTGAGWVWPSEWAWNYDTWFIASAGPFRLEPGEERPITIAIVGATSGDRLDAIVKLRASAASARNEFRPAENRPPALTAPDSAGTMEGQPIAVEIRATDPDGDPLTLSATGLPQGAVLHGIAPGAARIDWTPAMGQAGMYAVTLVAEDGRGGRATKVLAIHVAPAPSAAATAWPLPGDEVIRLRSGRPLVWLAVEPGTESFAATDIIPSSVTLSLAVGGSVAIAAAPGQIRTGIDQDRDGTSELGVAFTKDDLRALFSGLPAGRTDVPVAVEGALASGERFRASATLTVESFGPKLAAKLGAASKDRPATLTLQTTRPGRVRVTLFDVRGRAVRTLLERDLPPGYVDIPIAADAPGGRLPSGVYFYQVKSAEGSIGGRVLILR